jgi:hypothetical protein
LHDLNRLFERQSILLHILLLRLGWKSVVACLARILRLDTSQDRSPLYMLSNAVSRKNKILDMTLSTNGNIL